MAFSAVSGGVVTITTAAETMATAFAAAFNAPSGDTGTYIDRFTIDPAGTDQDHFIYKVKSLAFLISSGSLSILDDTVMFNEGCAFPNIRVNSGGKLNTGRQWTVNSVTLSHTRSTLYFCRNTVTNGASDTEAAIYVDAGGQWDADGVKIATNCHLTLIAGHGAVNLRNVDVVPRGKTGGQSGGQQWQIRFRGTALVVDGFRLWGEQFAVGDSNLIGSWIASPATAPSGYAPNHISGGIVGSATAGSNLFFQFVGYAGRGNTLDVGMWGPIASNACNTWEMIDSPIGNSLKIGTAGLINGTPGVNGSNSGITRICQQIGLQVRTKAGTGITTAWAFTLDKNNSGRRANGGAIGDYTADLFNVAAADGSGNVAAFRCYTGIYSEAVGTTGTLKTIDNRTPFVLRLRAFSYSMYEQDLNPTAPATLPVTKVPDPIISRTKSAALALTGISITDHGGSPAAWNGKNWGITVTGNLTTNPGLTANDIYQHIHAQLTSATSLASNTNGVTTATSGVVTTSGLTADALVGAILFFTAGPNAGNWATVSANTTTTITTSRSGFFPASGQSFAVYQAFGGKLPFEWHDMLVSLSASAFETAQGLYGGTRTAKGVRVVDQAGNPFPGFSQMQADDGTYYIPPVTYTYTVAGMVAGSRLLIRRTDTQAVLYNGSPGTSHGYTYTYSADFPVEIIVRKATSAPFYQEWRTVATLTASNGGVTANQLSDEG